MSAAEILVKWIESISSEYKESNYSHSKHLAFFLDAQDMLNGSNLSEKKITNTIEWIRENVKESEDKHILLSELEK